MPEQDVHQAKVLLLDIEGTTTPVAYVFEVLFPYAKEHLTAFLKVQGQDEQVQRDLNQLRQEYQVDCAQGFAVPLWQGGIPDAAIPYIEYLIAIDRKSTGLKSLQGKIWHQGYRDGTLQSSLFADVKPALERWTAANQRIYIFSSGSVQAQHLLFRYTQFGDLTPYISGYFDTQMGSKKAEDSYCRIAEAIGVAPQEILFISDVVDELQAAQSAGMQTLFSLRPGNAAIDSEGFPVMRSFAEVS
jgi:enolase-phosphatase E1